MVCVQAFNGSLAPNKGNFFNNLEQRAILCKICKKSVPATGGNKLVPPLEAKSTRSSITRLKGRY